MKRTLALTILGLSLATVTSAQEVKINESQVPPAVMQAFKAKYPVTKVSEWELENGSYEAEFKQSGKKYEASFDKSGNWIGTEFPIKSADVPRSVKDAFDNTEYKNWTVPKIKEGSSPEYEKYYEIEVKKEKQEVELYFTPDGKLIKTEKE